MSATSGPLQAPKNVVTFDKPTLVRRSEAVRFLWGDDDSHRDLSQFESP